MNKHLITILTIAAFSGLIFASCSKGDSSTTTTIKDSIAKDSTTKSMMEASWTLTRQATDNNNNGIADASEWTTPASSGISLATILFNANGTGSEHIVVTGFIDTTENFTWSVHNPYVVLSLSGNTTNLHIDTLTSHVFTLKDTTGGQANWTTLTK